MVEARFIAGEEKGITKEVIIRIEGRVLDREKVLEYFKRRRRLVDEAQLPLGLQIVAANKKWVKTLALEAARLQEEDKKVPTPEGKDRMHSVEKVRGFAVKTVDAIWPSAESIQRTAAILQYLRQKKRPAVRYIGHIEVDPMQNDGSEAYRAKILTRWVRGATPLDEFEISNEMMRKRILRQLAEHFAFFHGSWEKKETESEIRLRQRKNPRYYIRVGDCRLANFLVRKSNESGVEVITLDPETWELTETQPALADQHYDLANFLRQLYKGGVLRNEQDLKHFLYWYLGLFRPERKNSQRVQQLAQTWKNLLLAKVFGLAIKIPLPEIHEEK